VHDARVILLAAAIGLSVAAGAQPNRADQPLLGKISFPNSGSAAAQPAFVRGVLLLHCFEYDDAIAAFREAQRIDPAFALAYWGEAMCFNQSLWENEDVAKGRLALMKLAPTPAARQAKAPTPREKGYLDAVEKLYAEPGGGTSSPAQRQKYEKAARDRAHADRMGELSKQFPQDDEAAAFYALALLGTLDPDARDTTVSLKAGEIALAVLKRNPQHPGAAHYALHAFDDGEHATMGLEAARIYAKIAPASSHARHMPSHVFLPLGMWDEASASDEASFAVSVERVKRLGLSMAQADFHSLSWLHYEYLQAGRFAKARETMRIVEDALKPSQPAVPAPPAHHAESEIGRGFSPTSLESELASMRARLVVDAGAWDEMKGKSAFGNVDELLALGIASVKLGDTPRARAAYENLKTARDKAPDATNRQLAQIMMAEVAGLIQLAQGSKQSGLAALADGARIEASMPRPIARPYPVKPAEELYAEALLESGDAVKAIAQFQAALRRTPRRAAALLGLARAQQKANLLQDARGTARALIGIWHLADQARPELSEARRIAAQK
jgi:tetratricopeptide (TPR) repeat protein